MKNLSKKYRFLIYLFLVIFTFFGRIPFVSAQTAPLYAILVINPWGGYAPLLGVTITAEAHGTAIGPINYTFYCNRIDTGTDITPGAVYQVLGTNSESFTPPAGICDYVYRNPGTYLAKVIVERGGYAAEERSTVYVPVPPPVPPSVDIEVRPSGSGGYSDGPINIAYNNSVDLQWISANATSCNASNDWSGIKNTSGNESIANLTSSKIYTLTCSGVGGTASDFVTVNVNPPTLLVGLSANPSSGTAPLNGVVLSADVSGSALGSINYTFYCDRSDSGTNVIPGEAYRIEGTNIDPFSAPANICNSLYANPGTYAAKVIAERVGIAAQATTMVNVATPPPPPPPPDITPPTISNVQATNITDNSATIIWNTDEPATSRVRYGTTTSYGQQTTEIVSLSTAHSVVLYNLQPSTTYHFQVISKDAANNQSNSSDFVLTTPAIPTLSVVLSVDPASGEAPLTGVDLTANISGNVTGNINYYFYCNRLDSGIDIVFGYAASYIGVSQTTQTATNACTYDNAGTYTAKVIIERGGLKAEDRVNIPVFSVPPPPPTPPAPYCGDNSCNGTETCSSCPTDCGICPIPPEPPAMPPPSPPSAPSSGNNGFIVLKNPLQSGDVKEIINSFGGILRTIALVAGVLLIIIAGIMIMTSGGDKERLDRGKRMLKWTLIGFAIVVSASFIIDLIQEILPK